MQSTDAVSARGRINILASPGARGSWQGSGVREIEESKESAGRSGEAVSSS
jgi:hypothetical protein